MNELGSLYVVLVASFGIFVTKSSRKYEVIFLYLKWVINDKM
jgi:hypothetical protein